MIKDILSSNYEGLIIQLLLVFITWILVLGACGIDLYFGIKKSRENGIFKTHSYGLRKTSEKVVQYLAFMLFMVFIDIINPVWIFFSLQQIPVFSIFGAIVLIFTEWKSVREKSGDKFREDIKNNPAEIVKWLKENKEVLDNLSSKK